ncbi:MAG: hypothetical protein H6701_03640 [Myxococcales bacterium]|nr:hypothetical protein [Myxococcales bacterium]
MSRPALTETDDVQTPESRKRMMVAGTVVVAGLCVALFFAQPPADTAPREATPPAPAEATPPGLGEGCAEGAVTCAAPDPFCYQSPPAPRGGCTRTCPEASGCPEGWCCIDHVGGGDPRYFVCAPPAACADRAIGARRVEPVP